MLKSSVFLYSSPPYLFLKIGFLTKSLMWQDQLVGNFRDLYLPSLHSDNTGMRHHDQLFYVGTGDLNSGPLFLAWQAPCRLIYLAHQSLRITFTY